MQTEHIIMCWRQIRGGNQQAEFTGIKSGVSVALALRLPRAKLISFVWEILILHGKVTLIPCRDNR